MVKMISRQELLRMKRAGEPFTLIDVLSAESYANGHIPGAVSIPITELGAKANALLNKNDTIVTYCASFECTASTIAAQKLLALGYSRVLDYKGGLKDYRAAGLPLEQGETPAQE